MRWDYSVVFQTHPDMPLPMEDMQEWVWAPALGVFPSQVSPVSCKEEAPCLFACFNIGLCSLIWGGEALRRPTSVSEGSSPFTAEYP